MESLRQRTPVNNVGCPHNSGLTEVELNRLVSVYGTGSFRGVLKTGPGMRRRVQDDRGRSCHRSIGNPINECLNSIPALLRSMSIRPNFPTACSNDRNFYGTIYLGGAKSSGTPFKLATEGTLTRFTDFVLNQWFASDEKIPITRIERVLGDYPRVGKHRNGRFWFVPPPATGQTQHNPRRFQIRAGSFATNSGRLLDAQQRPAQPPQ